jgi:hypothetical protein
MNLNPTVWGPHAWFFLDSVVMGMPDNPSPNEAAVYKNFFTSLQFLLPCLKCRLHYAANLEESPLTDDILASKERMLRWLYDLHNKVRVSNGQQPRSYDEITTFYNAAYSGGTSRVHDAKACYLMIAVAVAILVYMARR